MDHPPAVAKGRVIRWGSPFRPGQPANSPLRREWRDEGSGERRGARVVYDIQPQDRSELSICFHVKVEVTIKANSNAITLALRMGIAVPVLYFGIQFAAAPFFPGYSFQARDASTLGSSYSSLPAIFNLGSFLVGLATFIASWGFFQSFRVLGVRATIAWPATLALIASGLAHVNACLFPLPDPRHTDSVLALAGTGTFLLPVLLPLALWKLLDRGPIRSYFVTNILALVALIPIMSGLIQRFSIMAGIDLPWYQTFLNNYQGLLQRIAAVIAFGPIAVSAWYLVQRVGAFGAEPHCASDRE